jgi:hypothetical protein
VPGLRHADQPGAQAGSQVTSIHTTAHTLQPWPGFGVKCLFVAIVYAIAWTLLDRRDAWWRSWRVAVPRTPAPAEGSDQVSDDHLAQQIHVACHVGGGVVVEQRAGPGDLVADDSDALAMRSRCAVVRS